jgi:DNA-binding protein H-NS
MLGGGKHGIALVEATAEKLKTTPQKILAVIYGKTVSKPRESKPVLIKYRDTAPGCDNNTWSGRGLAPLWLKRYEAAGRNRTEFLIK